MLGTGELIVILCVTLILFGGKKLPEFARQLGIGIREFKKACYGVDEKDILDSIKKERSEILVEEKSHDPNDRSS